MRKHFGDKLLKAGNFIANRMKSSFDAMDEKVEIYSWNREIYVKLIRW